MFDAVAKDTLQFAGERFLYSDVGYFCSA